MLTGLEPDWQQGKLVPAGQFRQLPLKIQMIISRMTSIDPANRYENLDMIIDKIDSVLKHEKPDVKKEKISLRTILIIVLILAAGVALFLLLAG